MKSPSESGLPCWAINVATSYLASVVFSPVFFRHGTNVVIELAGSLPCA